jgi:hypothetical protein
MPKPKVGMGVGIVTLAPLGAALTSPFKGEVGRGMGLGEME